MWQNGAWVLVKILKHTNHVMKLDVVLLKIGTLAHRNSDSSAQYRQPIDAFLKSIIPKYHEQIKLHDSSVERRLSNPTSARSAASSGPSSTHSPFSRMFWTMCKGGNENTLHHECNLQLFSWVTRMNHDASCQAAMSIMSYLYIHINTVRSTHQI